MAVKQSLSFDCEYFTDKTAKELSQGSIGKPAAGVTQLGGGACIRKWSFDHCFTALHLQLQKPL